VSISCDAFAHHLSIARASAVVFVKHLLGVCARAKATSRTCHYNYSENLLIARGHCFTLLNFSFAMYVSEPVTPIFVLSVETRALCHVRPAETTSKPFENLAVCRTRLSLPYVLRAPLCLLQQEKSTPNTRVRKQQAGWCWKRCRRSHHALASVLS